MFTSTPFPRGDGDTSIGLFPTRQSFTRGRQSFAYPLQQVFEETRSMLINDDGRSILEPSIFEATLGRNRMTLPAANVQDLIGALDSLHARFGIVIGSMTDRSQIFEVIDAWIDDIYMVMQHQRSNDSDISEANYRKLQSLFQKEIETWSLISQLYFQRLSDDGNLPEPFNAVIRDKYCINELPFVEAIYESDPVVKEMYTIIQWLETNFQKHGVPDLTEKFFIWENTWEALKRDKLVGKTSSKSTVSCIDPDAPTREGKQLHPLDDEENSKVLRGAFYYIRTGDIPNAISYLVKSGERIKASALCGYHHTAKVQEDPETGEPVEARQRAQVPTTEYLPRAKRQARPRPDFEIRGNTKRALWKNVTWKICEKKNVMSKYDRALIGAVCGHRDAMLDVAQTWEDRLWAHLRASVDVTIESALRDSSVPNNRKELPDSYWAQKLSIASCIEKVDAMSQSEIKSFTDQCIQLLQKSIMMDKMDQYIEDLSTLLPKLLSAFDHPLLNGHVARFYTHLLLFMGIVNLPYSQDLIDTCVENYVSVLVDVNQFAKIPFYIQKLSDDKKIPTIVRHINSNSHLDHSEILEFLESSQANDLDVLSIAVAVVDKMRDEEDDFSVENLDWIRSCYELVGNSANVMFEFLKYTIWISRKYLTLGNTEKVQNLISQLTPENVAEVAQISDVLENTLVREYLCYKVYLEAEDSLSLWKKALSQRPVMERLELPAAASKADRTVFEKKMKEHELVEGKWRRAVEFHLNSAIEKFLNILKFPDGWLRECYDPEDEDETIHVGAVRRIVLRKVVSILLRLIQDKNDNRTSRDFIYVLCDDNRNILCELSPPEIANVFKVVEQFTRQKVSNIMFLPK